MNGARSEVKYRETKTNTTSNSYNVREVHRDITQNRDGTVKTYEHETVKEQVFMHQEQISREVSNAKALYSARKTGEQTEILRKWQNPRWKKCKRQAERIKQFSKSIKSGCSDLPHMKSHRTLQDVVNQERRSIQFTCEDLEQEVGDLSAHAVRQNKKQVMAFADDAKHMNYGSLFVLQCLNAVTTRKRKRATVADILDRLKNQEDERGKDQGTLEVAPGVFKKIGLPKFPFTPEEQEILSHASVNPSNAEDAVYDRYLDQAIATEGAASTLMAPVLEQCLTAMLLLEHTTASRNPVVHFAFPELITITDVQSRDLDTFPFVPIDFWGNRKAQKASFACCQFELDTIYENVWIELPLLLHHQAYAEQAVEAFREFVIKATHAFIDDIVDPLKLIALNPQCPDFHQLKQLQRELCQSRANSKEARELRQLNKQVERTLKKLHKRQTLV